MSEQLSAPPQVKAWINNSKEQWDFWQVVVARGGCEGLNKTEAKARELASYFEGKYDSACNFRDWLAMRESKSKGAGE